MKKQLFIVGILAMALAFGLVLSGCSQEANDNNGKSSLTFYDKNNQKLYLRSQRWVNQTDSGVNWNSGNALKLNEFFTGTLKKDTWYTITVSGIADKRLEFFQVMLYQEHNNDWQNIGDWENSYPYYLTDVSAGSFTKSLSILIRNDITIAQNQKIWVHFTNDGDVPANVKDGTLMATISNFSMTFTESGGSTSRPNAPTSVYASSTSSSSITVSWPSVSNAAGYNVYRSSNSIGSYDYRGSSTSTSYTDTGLSSSTTYYYKVSAYNNAGESSLSTDYDWATTNSSGGGTSLPSAPTGVTAMRNPAGSTTVTISWYAVSNATSYRVYWSSTGSGTGEFIGSRTTTSIETTGNSTTITHYYRVSAVNSVGEGTPSSWVSVGPVGGSGTTRPGNVTSGSVTAQSSTSILLTWTTVSGATSYNIYRSTSSTQPSIPTYSVSGGSTSSYTDTGLVTGRQYLYWVTAVNSAGESQSARYIGAAVPSAGTGFTPPSSVVRTFTPYGAYESSLSMTSSVDWYIIRFSTIAYAYIYGVDRDNWTSNKTADIVATLYDYNGSVFANRIDIGGTQKITILGMPGYDYYLKIEVHPSYPYTGTYGIMVSQNEL